jgi:hypothetical protein
MTDYDEIRTIWNRIVADSVAYRKILENIERLEEEE